jgi:coatomer subunit beta'
LTSPRGASPALFSLQALRNKSFGQALDFVWSAYGTGDYAVRESTSRVKVFKNFKETHAFKPGVQAEGIYGGALLGVRSVDTVVFYDWDSDKVVRRIEVGGIKGVYWNETGTLVAIATDESYFVLRFSREAYAAGIAAATSPADAAAAAEEGIEAAFDLQVCACVSFYVSPPPPPDCFLSLRSQHETAEKVRNGMWVGDVFLYTNGANRLNYYVGGEVMTLAHLDRHMYLLGYLSKEGRVYLIDKAGAVVSYALLLSLVEYQTAVVRRDFAAANRILPDIPRDLHNSVAKFLEGQVSVIGSRLLRCIHFR